MKNTQDIAQTGITHLSFSAVRDFLSDRRNFRKKWIDHDFDNTPQLPLMEGSAFHAALAHYWQGVMDGREADFDGMVEVARQSIEMEYRKAKEPIRSRIAKGDIEAYRALGCEIEESVSESKSGRKTTIVYALQTSESILKGVIDNLPEYVNVREGVYKPVSIEQAFIARTKDHETGEDNPFPLKMRLDMVAEWEGRLVFVDHKYNGRDPETDEEGNLIVTPAMLLQGAAYVSGSQTILEVLGLTGTIDTVLFDIFNKKTGKTTPLPVVIGDRELIAWSRIYRGVQNDILDIYARGDFDTAFLPNPDAIFNVDGWMEYMRDIDIALGDGVREKIKKPVANYEVYEL